jgi:hypothetical protein
MRSIVLAIALVSGCGFAMEPPLADPNPALSRGAKARADMYARLRDAPGPVPGLDGYVTALVSDAGFCGGRRQETYRSSTLPSAEQQPLADMYADALVFPRNLDFLHDRDASDAVLNAWFANMKSTAEGAVEHYTMTLADQRPRLEAMARMAQVQFRAASLLARAAIPPDVSTGELAADKMDAYCDALHSLVWPLLEKAEEGARMCGDRAADAGLQGWWTEICY